MNGKNVKTKLKKVSQSLVVVHLVLVTSKQILSIITIYQKYEKKEKKGKRQKEKKNEGKHRIVSSGSFKIRYISSL